MPELRVRFTGLCLFVPQRSDPTEMQGEVPFVDVLLVDAITKLQPTSDHGPDAKNPDDCKVHAPHVPRLIFNHEDVEYYEILNPASKLWTLSPGYFPGSVSWLLTPIEDEGDVRRATGSRRMNEPYAQVVRLLDGQRPLSGEVTLSGENITNVVIKPDDSPADAKKLWYRWLPNVHRIFPALGYDVPRCPELDGDEFEIPDNVISRLRLMGGTLGSEDVLRDTSPQENPRVFRFESSKYKYDQAIAKAGLFTVTLHNRLVIETSTDPGGVLNCRIVFKNRPITLTVSNEPLPFMEGLIPPSDFELSYRPMSNVTHFVVPSEVGQSSNKPCGCTSC